MTEKGKKTVKKSGESLKKPKKAKNPHKDVTGDKEFVTRSIRRQKCNNHPDRRGLRFCESCDQPFCKECIEEFWAHNFLSYAFLGEKKDFSKEYLCSNCVKKKRRRGVLIATSLLVLFGIFIIASIFNFGARL